MSNQPADLTYWQAVKFCWEREIKRGDPRRIAQLARETIYLSFFHWLATMVILPLQDFIQRANDNGPGKTPTSYHPDMSFGESVAAKWQQMIHSDDPFEIVSLVQGVAYYGPLHLLNELVLKPLQRFVHWAAREKP